MLISLNNFNILMNPLFTDFQALKINSRPFPIYFGIPCIAFKVSVVEVYSDENFIDKVVNKLNNSGLSTNEIADILCLDETLIKIVKDSCQKSHLDKSTNYSSEETKDYYIFYNLITHEFINGCIDAVDFNSYVLSEEKLNLFKNDTIIFQNTLGDSSKIKVNILAPEVCESLPEVTPTDKDIFISIREKESYNVSSYKKAIYSGERTNVLICTGYQLTRYNSSKYSAFDPFKFEKYHYSEYFNHLILNYSNQNQKVLREKYILDCDSYIQSKRNEIINAKTMTERKVVNHLLERYKNKDIIDNYLINQMSNVITNYEKIKMYIKTPYKVINNIRVYYDSMNNVLERLFLNMYAPYEDELVLRLRNDNFFRLDNKYDKIIEKKDIYNKFFDNFEGYMSKIQLKFDTKLGYNIRKKRLLDRYHPNLMTLITLDVVCYYYFKEIKLMDIVNEFQENFVKYTDYIMEIRQEIRHKINNKDTNYNLDLEMIDNTYDFTNRTLDIVCGINKINNFKIENTEEDFDMFISSKNLNLDGIEEPLLSHCQNLLITTFNRVEMYYSDVVIAFEALSNSIIDYCFNFINSNEKLINILNQIPDDSEDAKINLLIYLNDIGIDLEGKIEHLKLDVKGVKDALLNNKRINSAASRILFVPLFLRAFDYEIFINLFSDLGIDYFNYCILYLDEREHSKQVDDWSKIDVVNEDYIRYCKIISRMIEEGV